MADRVVSYDFRGNFTSLTTGLAAAGKGVGDLGTKLTALDKQGERYRRGLSTMGDAAGKFGLLAAGGLAASAKVAIDWESAWAGVTKTVDGSAAQMATLQSELRGMAKELPASQTEIAGVAEAAGQLGVKTEDVAKFTRTMIDLGETTNLSANDAATSIARFTNIMGTSQDEVDRLGSTLVELGNTTATTEAEILTLGQRLSAAGSIAGLSESDVLAFAATLTSVGVEAEAGGTALSKVFTSIRDAAIDGGEDLKTFAEVAGVSAQEFRAAFEDDAAGAIDMFIQGLGRINESGQSTSEVFKDLGLTDQRLMRALLSTAGAGDLLSDSLDSAGQAWGDNTALAAEAGKRYDTTAAQMKIAMNQIRDAGIEIGEAILPPLAKVAEGVGAAASAFGNLPGPVKTATTALLGLTAVFGGGLWFTAKVIGGIATMKGALADLGIATGKTSGAMKGLARVGGAAVGLGIFVAGINEADAALGALETTAGAALIGFSVGGPWGAAIGAGIGLVTGLGAAHGKTSADVDALTATLDDQTGSLTENSREWAANELVRSGAAAAARELGLDLGSLTDAALGDKEAIDEINGALFRFSVNAENLEFGGASGSMQDEAERVRDAIGDINGAVAEGNQDWQLMADLQDTAGKSSGRTADELGRLGSTIGDTAGGVRRMGGEAEAASDSIDGAARATQGWKSALEQFNAVLTGRGSVRDYQESIDALRKSIKENGRSLDITTAKGRANQAALDGIASSALRVAENLKGADRRNFLSGARKDFLAAAETLGVTKERARGLANEFGLLDKKRVRPEVGMETGEFDGKNRRANQDLDRTGKRREDPTVGLEDGPFGAGIGVVNRDLTDVDGRFVKPSVGLENNASGLIAQIGRELFNLNGTTATTYVKTVRLQSSSRQRGGVPQVATGGQVFGPGGPTDDQVPALLSNREFVHRVAAVDHYGPSFMHALNSLQVDRDALPRFAGGGHVGRGSAARRAVTGGASGGGHARPVRIEFGDVTLRGTLDARTGKAQIEGIARAAATAVVDNRARNLREEAGA